MPEEAKKVFPVSKYIKDELLTRGWTQADLAYVMGRKGSEISTLLNGRRQLSPELAQELAVVLGRSAGDWLGIDNAYRLSQTDYVDQAVRLRSELFSFPIKEMQKRRWIAETLDTAELQEELERFLSDELGRPRSDSYELFGTSFKRTAKESELNNAERAWLARAKQLAKACPAGKFSENSIPRLKAELRRAAAKTQAAHRVPELLAGAGIRYVVVEPLPTVKIDGAAFWLDAESPVIAMSLRFDNIGSFWFALMHELDHIENRDAFSFDDLQSKPNDEIEERASGNAANLLVPQQELEAFIRACAPRYSEARINNLATRLQIHPGIVIGQLQFRGELSYAAHRKLLTKVRDIVTQFAFTDGWGQPVPQLLG
jgi:HTH-type transcriptional regulator / antitoxin HigA